jgi:hypothetical protein
VATTTARILGIHTLYQSRRRPCILPSEHLWSATGTPAVHSTQHGEWCTTEHATAAQRPRCWYDTSGVTALSAPTSVRTPPQPTAARATAALSCHTSHHRHPRSAVSISMAQTDTEAACRRDGKSQP